MTGIAPPPTVNPSASELERRRKANEDLGARIEGEAIGLGQLKRGDPVPIGFKRVYPPNRPHQGKKELQRRRKQLERENAKTQSR